MTPGKKRRHKLLNEVVTVISRKSKKVLDVQVFCRFVIHVLNGNTEKYTRIRKIGNNPNCSKNHIGSAGSLYQKWL